MKHAVAIILIILGSLLLFIEGQSAEAAVQYQVTSTVKTSTPVPSATQGTPPPTAEPSPTASLTPTTTLVPMPAITMIFPLETATSTATTAPAVLRPAETPPPMDGAAILSIPPRLRLLIIFVVLLWIFLVGFVVIYVRQLR